MLAERAAGAIGDGLPGRPIDFDEIEPWPDPVDGAELLSELARVIGQYVVMEPRQRDAVALWAAHAHAHDLRDASPPLVIKSPTMRSGKTKLIETLERLVPRPLFLSGITAAFLERVIETHRPTILIDEYDALTSADPALAEAARAQLNRSSRRRGARVGKNVPLPGGGYEARMFSTWAPTVIAGIGDPPATVIDRAIVIDLKRKLSTETVAPLRERDGADLGVLKRKIARFVADNETALRAIEPNPPLPVDNDRARDMWEPLLAVADVVGGDWPERAREAGKALVDASEQGLGEGNVDVLLLSDIRDIFVHEFPPDREADREGPGRPDDGPKLATKDLLEKLHGLEERPWGAWGRARKPMTDKALGDRLRPYGVRSRTIRVGTSTPKGYYLARSETLSHAISLHRPFQTATPPQMREIKGRARILTRHKFRICCGSKMPETSMKVGFVAVWRMKMGRSRLLPGMRVAGARRSAVLSGPANCERRRQGHKTRRTAWRRRPPQRNRRRPCSGGGGRAAIRPRRGSQGGKG